MSPDTKPSSDPLITEHLGDGYLKVNLVGKALKLYERALQLKPKEDQLNRLRKKIEADPSEPALIGTGWGIGYRFESETSA